LRDEGSIDKPVDVRLWRFIADVAAAVAAAFGPPPGVSLVAVYMFPVVDARGRVEEDAILGRPDPLRDVPLGAPEARFLSVEQVKGRIPSVMGQNLPLLNHVCF
jgi:hypothetical protein